MQSEPQASTTCLPLPLLSITLVGGSLMLTQKRLKELLHYNPITGIFIWKVSRQCVPKGRPAGCCNLGYVVIKIAGRSYKAHRLAWLYTYGYLPENPLDHIDRKPLNNAIANLREVSRSCNVRNTGNHKCNTSGVKGVSWREALSKWEASISIECKSIHLGRHDCLLEAACHRLAAEQAEDWANCDSSSPAFQHVCKYLSSIKQNRRK